MSGPTSAPATDFQGLRAQAAQLADGSASSADLVGAALDRIAASQPTLNAFRCVREDAARAEAAEADRRVQAGERLPLLGVPVAIKDDTDIAGETTAFGCAGEFPVASQDSEVVRRLRAAGAVIVGKTTTSEVGQYPWAEGPAFGVTRNPWDLERTPGGSSGGSAAAVAAGLVPAAVGSDGAGSVRIPAAWSHLVGIKPQRGRISMWPDPDGFHGLACHGPLARNVGDAALLLDVLTGNHPGDLHRPPAPAESFSTAATREPGRLRIALSFRIPFSGVPASLHPEIESGVRRLAEVLAGLGHEVIEADPRYGLVGVALMTRGQSAVYEWLKRVPDPAVLDRRTRENARVGRLFAGPVLRVARASEAPLQRRIGGVFDKADVVLAPTTAKPPLRVGATEGMSNWQTDKRMVAACPYTYPWNVVGWPSINVPAGLTSKGLPFGAQLMGPANTEAKLISLAAQLEQVERWDERYPPV